MTRRLIGAGVLLALMLVNADPVLAHGGNGGPSSDYRVEVTGFDGDSSGIALRSVELGNRMELRRTGAAEAVVLGYEGEPYLRLDADGVWENLHSPAHFLNLDRFAAVTPPASAAADAAPDWKRLGAGDTVRWHDHRAHWMGSVPPPEVQAEPTLERVIFAANRLDMIVDGRRVTALIRVTWLPPPPRTTWLIVMSLLAAGGVALFTLVRAARRWMSVAVVIAAVVNMACQGPASARVLAAAIVAVQAAVGLFGKWRSVTAIAAGLLGVLAFLRFEVFEHVMVAGAVAGSWQRVGITFVMVVGVAAALAQVVTTLSEPSAAPASSPASSPPVTP